MAYHYGILWHVAFTEAAQLKVEVDPVVVVGNLAAAGEACHCAGTPSPSLLKRLLEKEGGAAEWKSRRRAVATASFTMAAMNASTFGGASRRLQLQQGLSIGTAAVGTCSLTAAAGIIHRGRSCRPRLTLTGEKTSALGPHQLAYSCSRDPPQGLQL